MSKSPAEQVEEPEVLNEEEDAESDEYEDVEVSHPSCLSRASLLDAVSELR